MVLVLLPSEDAFARRKFRASKFADKLGAAEKAYAAGDYIAALSFYEDADAYLSAAIEHGDISEEQRPDAEQGLYAIRYQEGRSHQLLEDCTTAETVFRELYTHADVLGGVSAKVAMRLAESMLCVAESGPGLELIETAAIMKVVDELLARSITAADFLDEEERTVLLTESTSVQKRIYAIADAGFSLLTDEIEDALIAGECDAARAPHEQAESLITDATRSTHAAQLDAIQRCIADRDAAIAQAEYENNLFGLLPWVVVGLGGATLATAGIVEWVGMQEADDLAGAQSACANHDAFACAQAEELANSVSQRQVLTGVLLGVGVATLAGGFVWMALQDNDEADAAQEDSARGLSSIGASAWLSPSGEALGVTIHMIGW